MADSIFEHTTFWTVAVGAVTPALVALAAWGYRRLDAGIDAVERDLRELEEHVDGRMDAIKREQAACRMSHEHEARNFVKHDDLVRLEANINAGFTRTHQRIDGLDVDIKRILVMVAEKRAKGED